MLDKVNVLWEWLNGKKTAIGAVIVFLGYLAGFLPDALPAFGVDPAMTLKVVGVVTAILGALHKLWKLLFKSDPPVSLK